MSKKESKQFCKNQKIIEANSSSKKAVILAIGKHKICSSSLLLTKIHNNPKPQWPQTPKPLFKILKMQEQN